MLSSHTAYQAGAEKVYAVEAANPVVGMHAGYVSEYACSVGIAQKDHVKCLFFLIDFIGSVSK